LPPLLYRQQAVCTAEGVPFQSKVELMEAQIRRFRPLADTHRHVLLDSWYSAKAIWKAARDRGFAITTGLRSNRALRVADPESPKGWRWEELQTYARDLTTTDYQAVVWSWQGEEPRTVYVHVVRTIVRNLYRCRVIIVRDTLDTRADVRFWATSDLRADAPTLIGYLARRWEIEVLFADTKELLGLDQYQVMTATAPIRFWRLVLTAYVFLEEERDRLRREHQTHVTIGEAQREVQRVHWAHLISWMYRQFDADQTPAQLFQQLAA
jgi:hypothetical protein